MVKKIPGDGHCLFSAIIHQFYRDDIKSDAHKQKITELRRQVVGHIKDNYEEYHASLMDTVADLDHLGPMENEMRITEFLQRLEITNEWGGQETIAASAVLFNR